MHSVFRYRAEIWRVHLFISASRAVGAERTTAYRIVTDENEK